MHNRKVFVYKDVNYGASKTSATQSTALTPDQLADGSVGIYGIHEAGSTNVNKMVLITDGGSEAAGSVPMATFVGKEVIIAMGTSAGVQLSNPIQLQPVGLRRAYGSKYVAPVRGVLRIGYNGTAATSLNLPATILRGDDFDISLFNRNYFVAGGREPGQKVDLSVATTLSQTAYSILSAWIAKVNLRTDNVLIDKTLIKILHNGTGAVFATSATVAAVNGATTLTTSAAHGVTAGDLVSLGGDLYVSVTGTTSTTLILDRPYQGATATIANANTLDITAAPTAWGLELVDNADYMNIEAAAAGIAQDATILRYTKAIPGTGAYAEVLAWEKEALPKKGTEALTDATVPHDAYRAVSGTNYDWYIFAVQNLDFARGDQGSVFKIVNYLTVAFPTGVADTANKNQSDFEDILTQLFGTSFTVTISA